MKTMEPPTTPGMVLRSLVSGPSLADVPVPACLNHCINQEAFSCKVRHLVFLETDLGKYLQMSGPECLSGTSKITIKKIRIDTQPTQVVQCTFINYINYGFYFGELAWITSKWRLQFCAIISISILIL